MLQDEGEQQDSREPLLSDQVLCDVEFELIIRVVVCEIVFFNVSRDWLSTLVALCFFVRGTLSLGEARGIVR
ncbi:unnamed protein product [Closterium sp. NIES-53]